MDVRAIDNEISVIRMNKKSSNKNILSLHRRLDENKNRETD